MTRLLLWVVDHPLLAGGLVAMLTTLFALQLPRLEIDASAEGLMVERDPARQYFEEVKRKFGSDSLTVILVKADNVFAAPILGVIQRISDALARVEGVTRVESLTTVRNLRGDGDWLSTDALVPEAVPEAASERERIRRDALANRIFVGSIVSGDGRAAAINLFTEARVKDKEFSRRVSDEVDALIAREAAGGVTMYQVGRPLTKVTLAGYLRQDLFQLIPIAGGVLVLMLSVTFRMVQGVVVPLATSLVSVVWALGLMTLFGLPVNVLTGVIPALLIAVGFTEDVHMLSEYHQRLERGEAKDSALRGMARETGLPILVTTATTVVGFGSLVTSDVTMLIQFGLASSLALTSNFVVTVLGLPAMLRLWPLPRRFRAGVGSAPSGERALPRMMDRLGEFNLRHRIPIALVSALVVAWSLVGWARLRVDADFMSFFPERSLIRERFGDLRASMASGLTFYLVVETGREDGVKDPELLRRVAGLQAFVEGITGIDKTVSVTDYLRKMHREMNGGDPAFEVLPGTREEIAQYLLALEGGELAKYVDFAAATLNILVRHDVTSSWDLSSVLKRIDSYVAEAFPKGVRVRPTGEAILTRNAADYMAVNELTSFSFTFVVIGAIHALLFKSLWAGFLSLIPNVIPILSNFGLMGLVGIPLNVGTALVATIAIGIAVDDTVHHMVRYSRELKRYRDRKAAMLATLRAEGRPILYVSMTLAAGFLVLAYSNFVPTYQFGLLSSLVMLVAMVGELVLTPILMYSTRIGAPGEPGAGTRRSSPVRP
ncbi:MAG: MMPL family transporter [Candidatus Rokubacteria bacterium]|nr:MMPL family transporter [Candidatus Rokubacteria bacterium]